MTSRGSKDPRVDAPDGPGKDRLHAGDHLDSASGWMIGEEPVSQGQPVKEVEMVDNSDVLTTVPDRARNRQRGANEHAVSEEDAMDVSGPEDASRGSTPTPSQLQSQTGEPQPQSLLRLPRRRSRVGARNAHAGSPAPAPAPDEQQQVVLSPTACWSIAVFNKSKIRAFLHTYHFTKLHPAEGGLFSAVLYALADQHGGIEAVSDRRPVRVSGDHTAVRMVLLGTWDMFTSTYAPRHFFFDLIPPSGRSWNHAQTQSLQQTAHQLNNRATWLHEGVDRWRSGPLAQLATTAGPAQVVPPSPPYISLVGEAGSLRSPPGHDHGAALALEQPAAETLEQTAERVAMQNLKKLGDANIPQTSATLFVDSTGRIQAILYARPQSESLGFVGDEERHLHVVRIHMTGTTVVAEHVYEHPNKLQALVCRIMENVLREACRNHARRTAAVAAGQDAQQQQQQQPHAQDHQHHEPPRVTAPPPQHRSRSGRQETDHAPMQL